MKRIQTLSILLCLLSFPALAERGTLHCEAIENSGVYVKSMDVDFDTSGDSMIVHWNGKTYTGQIDPNYNPRAVNANRLRFNGFEGMGNDSGIIMYSGNERYANETISMKIEPQLLDGQAGSVKIVGDYGRDEGPAADFLVCR